MPNLTLLSILAVTIGGYTSCMWVTKMITGRGDDIVSGIIKGVPVSTRDRWLMLITDWLSWVALQVSLLIILGLGILEIARGANEPRVALIGYMCCVMCAFGAVFWTLLGSVLFANMMSTIRKTARS
ncbi:MAG: hypothetical protein HKN10_12120 [Myxococcales bacterium]|nr:hypothetical protein [Myxococcales bacterium]